VTDLERLIAIEDIRTLQSRYVRYADSKDWDALVGCFLPDASFTPHDLQGRPQVIMTGRDAIKERVSTSVGNGTALHHLLSYEIEVESSTSARGVWAMEDWIDRSNDDCSTGAISPFKTMHGCGHYHATYEKVGGVWFIADLKLLRVKLEFTH
jgi:SnoaL-like domain